MKARELLPLTEAVVRYDTEVTITVVCQSHVHRSMVWLSWQSGWNRPGESAVRVDGHADSRWHGLLRCRSMRRASISVEWSPLPARWVAL
jgi:hypothetical protein